LTIWHFFAACQPNAQTIGRAAKYFPVVGLMLGLTLALVNYMLAPYRHSEILSAALIAFLIAATGGLHLEGLNKTLLTRHWLQRRHGVVTHANSGAVVELGEALSLVLLATL